MQPLLNDASVAPRKRRLFSKRRGAALFAAAGALALLAAVLTLPPVWRATDRREAYLPQLQAAVRSRPEDGPLAAQTAARLMQAGEFREAAGTLKQAAGAGEQTEAVWLALASSNAAAGRPDLALADLRLGVKSLPDSTLLPARLAEARALAPGSPPGALAGAISPQGPEALLAVYGRGSFLDGPVSWWGRQHPARSGFATRQTWAAASPRDAEAQRLWGEALVRNRRPAEAVPVLRAASALAPNSPACRLALADALRSGGHLQDAAQEYLAALRLRPDWVPALMGLGSAFEASDLPGYAISSYRRATEVAPRSADAWVGLGSLLHHNDGVVASLPAFEAAARLDPARTDYLDDYADALRQANRWDQAEAVLRRRLAAAPGDAYGHFVLGLVLMDSKPTPAREAEATSDLRESLRLSPRNPVAEVSLAELLLDQGQAPEALPMLLDSLRRLPFERRTTLLLSRAYRLTGQDALAAQAGKRAADLQRAEDQASVMEGAARAHLADVPFHQRLAALYDRIGKPDKAAQERLTIQRLQTGPQKVLHTQQDLADAVGAVLHPH